MARPTDYDIGIVKKSEEYLEGCKDEFGRLVESERKDGTIREDFIPKLVVRLPSIAGLSVYLKVARSTIYEWKSQHKEFSDILEKILAEQEKRLIEMGLSGDYNSNIAKLALGKHGYSEKTEITGKDGKDLIPDSKDIEAGNKALEEL